MQKTTVPQISKKTKGLTRRAAGLMALEQRFMFDGAAVDVAHDQLVDTTVIDSAQHVTADMFKIDASTSNLTSAAQLAQQQVRDYLVSATDGQLFALFNGGKNAPDDAWAERLGSLREALANGSFAVNVVAMDSASQFTAMAAFTENGPNGEPTIFINTFWFGMLDAPDTSRVLVEELGHAFDAYLNPNADTSGDEGESFADSVIDGALSQEQSTALLTQNDHGQVTVGGVSYDVEFASLNFVNAYEMVYDLDNDTAGDTTVVPGDVDVNERWADKEQNSHYFNASVSLGVTSMTDGTNGLTFSGNDVSGAVSVTIGGTTYYGWVSRPIKSGGVVRGFYFWTDSDFTTLNAAQTDGNQDRGVGDPGSLDNRGFLLVVDQNWFTQQINSTGVVYDGLSGRPAPINNYKDGNDGAITVANVGSSSDRVDTALNSVLTPNSAPTTANDSLTVNEDSGPTTVIAANGLLSNDSDANSDSLTITGYTISGINGTQTVGSTVTIAGVGDILINADGSYTFHPVANYTGSVPPITYTVSDGHGGTSTAVLSITVTPVNDAPAGTDAAITVRQSQPYTFSASSFGFTDPIDAPANNLTSVIITTLPSSGTLTLNGVNVTAGQEILASDLPKLQYTTTSGTGATFTFQVKDDGGTASGGVNTDQSPNTITINVTDVNHAPTAVVDTVIAVEAGGSSNQTAGTNPSVNAANGVLSNDTDTDSGDTKTVTAVSGVLAGAVGGATNGTYGTLTLNADGSYSYVVNNNLSAVQALRLTTNTLTDTFSYTVTDSGGLTSSSTLTVTIQGANDAPVANPDFNTTTISTTVQNTINGSVLTNDTDVDANSESKSIVGLYATGLYASYTPSTTSTRLVFSSSNGSTISGVNIGNYVYYEDGSNNFYHLATTGGTKIQVTSKTVNSDGTFSLGLSGDVAKWGVTSITLSTQTLTFSAEDVTDGNNITGTKKTATLSTASTVSSSTVTVTGTSSSFGGVDGTIVVGMSVSGTNIPVDSKVTAVSISGGNTVITIDKAITSTPSGTLTFTAAAGSTVSGAYGTLTLNANGGYTYVTYIDPNASGKTGIDVFSYKMQDDATNSPRLYSSSTLTINLTGPSATLMANPDSETINEDNTASGSLVTNDTSGGTKTVSSFVWNGVVGTLGTPMTITGVGTLTINANGSYTFAPVSNYSGGVPVVNYVLTDGSQFSASTLTITITPVNDAPTTNNDTVGAKEAGGYSNATLGVNPTGNVLTNDADPDGNTLTVSGISGGTVGVALSGAYGSLTLNANGTYSYVVSNSNSTVQALAVNGTLTDTFTYTVSDGNGGTATATLTVTINGANDSPINTLPASAVVANFQTSTAVTGISIDDVDNAASTMTTQLTVLHGNISIGNLNGASITSGASGSATLTLSGTLAQINAALATLSYTGNTSYSGSDELTVQTTDPGGLVDVDRLPINVGADTRLVTVMGSVVNEASPYVMFEVSGVQNQYVSLVLGTTGNTTGHATMGVDFLPNLEYLVGSTWTAYTGGLVQIADVSGKLLVRTAVLQDTPFESTQANYETLKLTAKNAAGTSNVTTNGANFLADGTARIRDDGRGSIYLNGNTSFTPSTPPTYLDDDRPVTVNSIVVNEASPYAVLTISGYSGQVLNLAWTDLTAKKDASSPGALDGTEDYGPLLEYWDPTVGINGGGWVDYNNSVTMSGSSLFVRTSIVNDDPYEGLETFALEVTKVSSGTKVYGSVSVVDDGTGTKYPNDDPTDGGVATDTNSLNDDRTITVTGGLTFNEASPYATFTVSAVAGAEINLTLGTTGFGAGHADISGFTTSYSEDGGATWINYTWNGTTGNRPTVPANGAGSSLYGTVLVRVNIASEEEGGSDVYEGAETFTLTANYVTNNAITSTGADTIVDDGTGRIDRNGDGDTGDSNEGTGGPGAGYEDDRTIDVVGGLTFNEGSRYATFTVTAIAGQTVDLILNDSTSDTATISGFTYQYSLNGGSSWSSSYAYNNDASGVTVPGSAPGTGTILVRVDIGSEEESAGLQDGADALEGAEPFSFTARYTSNTSKTDTATDTITDDGTGKIDNDGDGGLDEGGIKESDGTDIRTLDVVGGITFNEASTYATFTVTGAAGSVLNLELGNTPSTSDQDATIANFSMQYNTGGGWVTYTWNGAAGNRPTVPAGGTFTVRVNISSETDSPFEGAETFTLKASYATNSSISDTDTDTIIDDGTGKIDNDGDGGSDEGGSKDDDRPLTVNNIRVNEGSPFAVFTVTGKEGQQVKLNLGNGTATIENGNGTVLTDGSEDFGPALQYWNGSAWTNYTANSFITIPSDGDGTTGETAKLLVRTAVNPDALDEGDHTFTLTATNTGGSTGTGTATIDDHGGGVKYPDVAPTGPTSTDPTPGTDTTSLDDDRPITVTGGNYNENSPRAVFTVNANPGQVLTLDVQNAAPSGKAPTGDNEGKPNDSLDTADIYYSLDGGATWQLYTGPVTAGSVPVLVAVDITNERDDVYEGEEQLKLVVTSGGQSASDYASIFDDGTGDITAPIDQNTRNNTGANDPAVVKDDDRPITVTGGTYNENSPRAVFTVNANPGQVLTLDVQNAAQSGKAPTGDNEGKPNDSLDTAPIYYSLDGGATWQLYTGPVTAGSVPVLVAVDITNERDDVYEGEEQLKLVVTSGGQSASDYASIFDDGTGDITAPIDQNTRNNAGANDPAVVKDDDRPKAALPPTPPAPAAPPAPPAEPIPLPPVAPPPQAFSSTLAPLAPSLVPAEPPMSLGEVLTSNSGYPIPASETAPVGLTINRGVTDQFIQSTDAASKISLPFDAFIHSNKDAVIKLEAKNADNSPLPQWVQFDPATGVFEVTPPKGFKGKLDLKVIARDDDGREAVAMFQMFVGEQTTNRVQSRDSFSEKLRLAGKRPITLMRVADSAKVQGREGVAVRVRAG